MKKLMAFLLTFVCLISLIGCNQNQPTPANYKETSSAPPKEESISDYMMQESGRQYLILPISNTKIRYDYSDKKYLEQVDLDTLKTAEENLTSKVKEYTDAPHFYLQSEEDCLYLGVEVIVQKDSTDLKGCGLDHEHFMYTEQLTK